MTTCHTTPATCWRAFAPNLRRARAAVIACTLLCTAAVAHTANATGCPPGYLGTPPKCVPGQVHPRHVSSHPLYGKSNVPSSVPVRHAGSSRYTQPHPMAQDRSKVKPQIGPGPVEHRGSTSGSHGIIFVGGHAQGIAPGSKQALNPQPIPPGHQAQTLRHPIGPRPATLIKPKAHGSDSH